MISPKASALYSRLVADGPSPVCDDVALEELDDLGLTYRSRCSPGMVLTVAPEVAVTRLVAAVQQEITHRHDQLNAALADVSLRQRELIRGPAGVVDVLTERDSIMRAADEVLFGARAETMEFAVATHRSDLGDVEYSIDCAASRGVRSRVVYASACLDSSVGRQIIRHYRESGEQQRFFPGWLTSLRIADNDAALVPLSNGSGRTALLVRSHPWVLVLRQWFELVWDRAEPIGQTTQLTDMELEILELQAKGHKDAAIARTLGVSVRTVRRHVATILTVLGVHTRFAAGVEAVHRGLLKTATGG